MSLASPKLVFGVILVLALATLPVHAQDSTATLAGTVAESSGKLLSDVKVSAKNLTTDQSFETRTDSTGAYTLSGLAPGDYEVSATSDAAGSATSKVTVSAGARATLALALTQNQEPPRAPSPSKTEPSLADLGFSAAQTQANAQEQARLDKRTHMLKIHQRMGLITTIPMIASVVTSFNAGGRSEGTASRDLHVALGALTGDLYGITAYYAIRAPRIAGTETKGPIKAHKILAWIHGPGMIATPILGAIAFKQKNSGEKVHGVASAHGPVAIVTAGAFGAALLTVSVKF